MDNLYVPRDGAGQNRHRQSSLIFPGYLHEGGFFRPTKIGKKSKI